jgi:hypothetical protein
MMKRYAVKPKDAKCNKFWNKKSRGRWDPKEVFDLDYHTTEDLGYAMGQMSENASRVTPNENWPSKTPIPVKIVEIEIEKKGEC